MKLLRIFQALLFLITLGVGLLGLLLWQPQGALDWADDFFSPSRNESFRIGAKIEDKVPAGSRDRIIREIAPPSHTALEYVVCEIDDDPEQVNAFGIYHPADLAITLGNLKEQGVQRLFISTHLHWPEKDLEETNTLATAMRHFQSVVVTAPLRRNFKSDPIPPEFLSASIPLSQVTGQTELIPVVNSLAVPPSVLFPENVYAGFSQLESEQATDQPPLLARWNERIVFSSTLLTLMQHCRISPDQLQVKLGSWIRIGNTGNIIPIDNFGRFAPDPNLTLQKETAPMRTISSALSGEASIIGATQTAAILTATGEKSSQFEAVGHPYQKLSQLAFTPRVTGAITLHRIPIWLECIILTDLALLCAWLLAYSSGRRNIAFIISIMAVLLLLLILYHTIHYWSPTSIYLLTLMAGWTLSFVLAKPARRTLNSDS
ncbi:hypothetical protein ACFPK9_09935 [Rubritalea spongiae]|uniref:CHASE2 domain-containing protein n=1 Tax=Rubritalea spongiae TaxID=430797 RepID=A0ABW5DZN3_9BACT